jgi:hypothetical protein
MDRGGKGDVAASAPQFDVAHAHQVYARPTTRARASVPIESTGRMRWMVHDSALICIIRYTTSYK